jgi:hypothetical protein
MEARLTALFLGKFDSFAAAMTASKPSTKLYCYYHGYCFHKGVDCTLMKADPSKYSTAMLRAKDHSTGGSKKNI